MVNKVSVRSSNLGPVSVLLGIYGVLVVGTIAALAVLSSTGSGAATAEAWGHAVLVAVFAVLLPIRLRAARRGSTRALRVVGIVAAILVLVNVVEAAIPGLFPGWMRVEMLGIAALMAGVVVLVRRAG